MQCYSLDYLWEKEKLKIFSCLCFIKQSWNDYGYYTLFRVYHFNNKNDFLELGYYRIMNISGESTVLPLDFNYLPNEFCSLGMSEDFYHSFFKRDSENIKQTLLDLNDVSLKKLYFAELADNDCFNKSLLRGLSIDYVKENFETIINGTSHVFNQEFCFSCRIGTAIEDHKIDFSFKQLKENFSFFPHRINCLVGKNATGKTIYLAKLAEALSMGQNNEISNLFPLGRPQYNRIITVSFSIFDSFQHPSDKYDGSDDKLNKNYYYCGFHTPKGYLMSEGTQKTRLYESYKQIRDNDRLFSSWHKNLNTFLLDTHLEILAQKVTSQEKFEILLNDLSFSSGQYIMFYFVTYIIANISLNSLILFDEPELHLHPNAISQLFEILNNVLNEHKSFAILATHSPIIIQQIPKKYVRIISRHNNLPVITPQQEETFGENLSRITRDVFDNIDIDSFYIRELERASKTINRNNEYIKTIFDNDLSIQANLFLDNSKNE